MTDVTIVRSVELPRAPANVLEFVPWSRKLYLALQKMYRDLWASIDHTFTVATAPPAELVVADTIDPEDFDQLQRNYRALLVHYVEVLGQVPPGLEEEYEAALELE